MGGRVDAQDFKGFESPPVNKDISIQYDHSHSLSHKDHLRFTMDANTLVTIHAANLLRRY